MAAGLENVDSSHADLFADQVLAMRSQLQLAARVKEYSGLVKSMLNKFRMEMWRRRLAGTEAPTLLPFEMPMAFALRWFCKSLAAESTDLNI